MDYIPVKRERKLVFIKKESKKEKRKEDQINKSLDELHVEKMVYFKNLYTVELKIKQNQLSKDMSKVNRQRLEAEIYDIQNNIEESFYFLKVNKVLLEYFDTKDYEERKRLTKEYYSILNIPYKEEIHFLHINNYECEKCGGEKYQDEEALVCLNCGVSITGNIAFVPSYKEISDGSYVFTKKVIYKRESYFLELLKNIQNVKTSDFPEDLIKEVKKHLYVNSVTHTNDINPQVIRNILKRLNYSKYYDQIQSIICIINQQEPLSIPKPVEEILKHMFRTIQNPWVKCKGDSRHSFFSYPYVLYKFFQILDLDDYLPYLTLLKSREKLIKHELLWEKIMDYINVNRLDKDFYFEINWRYIPLV